MASPYPQPAWYGPAPLAPSALPSTVSRAVRLMRAGAAFAVVYGVVFGLFRHALVTGMVFGVFVSLLWLWMAWKNEAGRNWARVLSSVFFGFQCPGVLVSVIGRNWSLALLAAVIQWGIGLAALILLWRPESSQFFAAARQARLTAASVAPHQGAAHPAGTQGPGYGQPAEGIPL